MRPINENSFPARSVERPRSLAPGRCRHPIHIPLFIRATANTDPHAEPNETRVYPLSLLIRLTRVKWGQICCPIDDNYKPYHALVFIGSVVCKHEQGKIIAKKKMRKERVENAGSLLFFGGTLSAPPPGIGALAP